MGWCSATGIFDGVMHALDSDPGVSRESKEKVAEILYDTLTENDWDCEYDSDFLKEYLLPIMLKRGDIDQEEFDEYSRIY
jgi:hypothetical protein